MPLSHKLQSGDQVEILTSKSQRVQPQWEVFATTARARAKIAAILRKERKANQKIGEEILSEFLKKEEVRPEEAVIEKLRKLHNAKNEEELLAAIGSKAIVLGEADKNELKEKQTSNWKKYLTFSFGNNKEKQEEKEPQEKEKINPKQVLKLTEESLQKKYIMAECCHPIPGDHYPQTPMPCCRQTEEQLWQPYISNRMGYTQRIIFPGIYIYKRYRQYGTFE